jgi:hypothetical protein
MTYSSERLATSTWFPAGTDGIGIDESPSDEDIIQVNESFQQSENRRLNNVVVQNSPEVRKSGAFGFPQESAKILADQPEARYSAWSNGEFLFVQVVVWGDENEEQPVDARFSDQTLLLLDLDADRKLTPKVDRTYTVDSSGIDSPTGRGSVDFVPIEGGKKLRVDSFLIPLAELGKKAGDTIRLIISGTSIQPQFSFNSAKLSTNGKALFYMTMPYKHYTDFTLGQQTGTVDSALVPNGRGK